MKAVPAFVRNPRQILLFKNSRFLLLLKHYVEELIASARCNLIVVITGRLAVGIYINKSSLDIHTYIHLFYVSKGLFMFYHVLSSVSDPDLEIRGIRGGRGGGGHPDPELSGGGAVSPIFFLALRATVWSENKGVPGPSGPSPGSATVRLPVSECLRPVIDDELFMSRVNKLDRYKSNLRQQ